MYLVYCLQFDLSLTFISDSYKADNCSFWWNQLYKLCSLFHLFNIVKKIAALPIFFITRCQCGNRMEQILSLFSARKHFLRCGGHIHVFILLPSLRPLVYRCLQIRQLYLPGWNLFVLLSAVSYLDSREPGKQDVNNASEISQNKSHIPYRHVLVKRIISMVESSFAVPLQRAKIPNSYSTRNSRQINTADFLITR